MTISNRILIVLLVVSCAVVVEAKQPLGHSAGTVSALLPVTKDAKLMIVDGAICLGYWRVRRERDDQLQKVEQVSDFLWQVDATEKGAVVAHKGTTPQYVSVDTSQQRIALSAQEKQATLWQIDAAERHQLVHLSVVVDKRRWHWFVNPEDRRLCQHEGRPAETLVLLPVALSSEKRTALLKYPVSR